MISAGVCYIVLVGTWQVTTTHLAPGHTHFLIPYLISKSNVMVLDSCPFSTCTMLVM